jgi:hypothetical protein|tara:strand:+ start:8031 stop:8219 length:189 start_codon:yes stop_codon:yes gene_type:complete
MSKGNGKMKSKLSENEVIIKNQADIYKEIKDIYDRMHSITELTNKMSKRIVKLESYHGINKG